MTTKSYQQFSSMESEHIDHKGLRRESRNCGIELMRLVMMLGVVAQHAVSQCAYVSHGVDKLTNWCVCGFVFLSGYFGIRFSWSKCARLYALGVFYVLLSKVCDGNLSIASIRSSMLVGHWFLWAYIMLMCFAPIIEKAFAFAKPVEKLKMASPLLFVTFVWSILAIVPGVRKWVPNPGWLAGCNYLPLLAIYVFVDIYKEFNLSRFCTKRNAVWALPVCAMMMMVGFWHFWWIPSVVVTCFAFEYFRQLNIGCRLSKIVLFLAPSSFGIYLFHMTGFGLKQMSNLEVFLVKNIFGQTTLGLYATFAVTTFATFAICLFVDVIRRITANGLPRGPIEEKCR